MRALSRLGQSVAGWIYPPTCGVCELPLTSVRHLERPFLCEECDATLEPVGRIYCRVCGQSYEMPNPARMKCANCGDRELAIDFAVSAYRSSGVARELVHRYKYGKQQHLSRLMGVLLDRVWRDERLLGKSWWVVPVPLHRRRMRERQFNQSLEVARHLVRRAPQGVGLELLHGLKRVRHTMRQAQLDRGDRLTNLVNAFQPTRALERAAEEPARFLIVDDVITTGTTVSECAAAIRNSVAVVELAAVSVVRG